MNTKLNTVTFQEFTEQATSSLENTAGSQEMRKKVFQKAEHKSSHTLFRETINC